MATTALSWVAASGTVGVRDDHDRHCGLGDAALRDRAEDSARDRAEVAAAEHEQVRLTAQVQPDLGRVPVVGPTVNPLTDAGDADAEALLAAVVPDDVGDDVHALAAGPGSTT